MLCFLPVQAHTATRDANERYEAPSTRTAPQAQSAQCNRHIASRVEARGLSRFPPHSYGEVAASYADGGVMSSSRIAHDPSVADRALSHFVRRCRRDTSP